MAMHLLYIFVVTTVVSTFKRRHISKFVKRGPLFCPDSSSLPEEKGKRGKISRSDGKVTGEI
jgi:hypothetical protein